MSNVLATAGNRDATRGSKGDANDNDNMETDINSEKEKLTNIDRKKLQMKIEEMKREISEHNNNNGASDEDEEV